MLNEVTACEIPRILRHGLAVVELAENDLPGVPSAVFAFKEVRQDRQTLLYSSACRSQCEKRSGCSVPDLLLVHKQHS